MTTAPIKGGCHCGAVRFSVFEIPTDVGYCHCRDCQKTSGAPALVWAVVPVANMKITQGVPKVYESSKNGRRHFCSDCGSQLFFTHTEAQDIISSNTGCFDDPELVTPKMHIWISREISWFHRDDGLPRHEKDPPNE